jgi:putative Holliday junction resolvase
LTKDQTYIAFDFGTKKIGVAVGQEITMTATPTIVIRNQAGTPDWKQIFNLIEQWRPSALVVGVPLNMDGTTSPITQKARLFGSELQQKTDLPVYEVDERLTTVEARQMLFDLGGYKALKTVSIDSFAAKLILETWMRSNPRGADE